MRRTETQKIDNRDPITTTVTDGDQEVTVNPIDLFKNALVNMATGDEGNLTRPDTYYTLVIQALEDANDLDREALKYGCLGEFDQLSTQGNIDRRDELLTLLKGAIL